MNQPSPQLIIQTFSVPAVMTSIYKGKFTVVEKDVSPYKSKTFKDKYVFSNLNFNPIEIGGEIFKHISIDTALFSVSQTKNIVRTPINGRNGQVKEYTGMDDYVINIKGVICGSNGVYPMADVNNLMTFLTYGQSLGITSKYLNDIFSIFEVVVYDFDIPQKEGGISQQEFTISCYSDKPVEILISEAQQ